MCTLRCNQGAAACTRTIQDAAILQWGRARFRTVGSPGPASLSSKHTSSTGPGRENQPRPLAVGHHPKQATSVTPTTTQSRDAPTTAVSVLRKPPRELPRAQTHSGDVNSWGLGHRNQPGRPKGANLHGTLHRDWGWGTRARPPLPGACVAPWRGQRHQQGNPRPAPQPTWAPGSPYDLS